MTFDELNLSTPLRNALEDLGYVYPTPIQEKSFSHILSGKDIIGLAQTGTGKTFAYLLPILRDLKYSDQKAPRVLIIVPTRELVLQVVGEIEKLTSYITVRVVGVYGGTNINTQKQIISQGLDILVATPGRLLDLVLDKILRVKSIQKLVIDEVDELLDLGFGHQLINFIESIPQRRQNIMFSATMSKEVEILINNYFLDPVKIEVVPHGTPLEKIDQSGYFVPNFFTKINLLAHLLKNDPQMSKVLVFANSKRICDKIFDLIAPQFGDTIGVLHSGKAQNYRINSLKKFDSGEYRIMISTDVMARGLDIAEVSHVVNFDIPETPSDYIHRIGRTGRADKDGIALSFSTDAEEKFVVAIQDLMRKQISLRTIPVAVEISNKYTEEERPNLGDKSYLNGPKVRNPTGAFHEKKEKNKKVNLGGLKVKAQERNKHKTGKINKRGMK